MKLILIISILLVTACKTRDQIEQEKKVDSLIHQVKDGQGIQKKYLDQLNMTEDRIKKLTSNMELLDHETNSKLKTIIIGLENRVTILENLEKKNTEDLSNLSNTVKEQKVFIKDVLNTLKNFSSLKKSTKTSNYQKAKYSYGKGNNKKAKKYYLLALKSSKTSSNQRAASYHNLGMIAFSEKKNNQAIKYFTTLYSKFSSSRLNRTGLYFLGKTFLRLKKLDEANATFSQVITKYPKSKTATDAKKLIKK